jgi:hypothetical protein
VSELGFGRQIVNRMGRDTGGLGQRRSEDDHRLLARYRAPVEMRLEERRRQRVSDEDETEAKVDQVVEQWLQREERLR